MSATAMITDSNPATSHRPAPSPVSAGSSLFDPCPVPYCDDASHHAWREGARFHRRNIRLDLDRTGLEVGAEFYERVDADGVLVQDAPVVEIGEWNSKTGSVEFVSWAEVSAFKAALTAAATDAFGPEHPWVGDVLGILPPEEGPHRPLGVAPPVTPCPSWCTESPCKWEPDGGRGNWTRCHTGRVPEAIRQLPDSDNTVDWCENVHADGSPAACEPPEVKVDDGYRLQSREEAAAFLRDLAETAELAFPGFHQVFVRGLLLAKMGGR